MARGRVVGGRGGRWRLSRSYCLGNAISWGEEGEGGEEEVRVESKGTNEIPLFEAWATTRVS